MKTIRMILAFPFKALAWIAFAFFCAFMAAWTVIEQDPPVLRKKPGGYRHER